MPLEIAVRTLTEFLNIARLGLTGHFRRKQRLQPVDTDLVTLPTSMFEVVGAIGLCFLADGTRFYMATSLISQNAMGGMRWAFVSTVSTSQLWPCAVHISKVSSFSKRLFSGSAIMNRCFSNPAKAKWAYISTAHAVMVLSGSSRR